MSEHDGQQHDKSQEAQLNSDEEVSQLRAIESLISQQTQQSAGDHHMQDHEVINDPDDHTIDGMTFNADDLSASILSAFESIGQEDHVELELGSHEEEQHAHRDDLHEPATVEEHDNIHYQQQDDGNLEELDLSASILSAFQSINNNESSGEAADVEPVSDESRLTEQPQQEQNQESQLQDKQDESLHELDLASTIFNAFESLTNAQESQDTRRDEMSHDKQTHSPQQPLPPATSYEEVPSDPQGGEDHGDDLSSSILDAFKSLQNVENIAELGVTSDQIPQPTEDNVESEVADDQTQQGENDVDLSSTIMNAFQSLADQGIAVEEHEAPQSMEKVAEIENETGLNEVDLSSTILNAFESLSKQHEQLEATEQEPSTTIVPSHHQQGPNPEDLDLSSVIASLNAVIEQGGDLHEQHGDHTHDEREIDLSQVVQNLVHQMNTDESGPHLSQDSDDALQSALAQMVRNVIDTNNQTGGDEELISQQEFNEVGLDQDQMNEILHNAFNLAMEQPSGELHDEELINNQQILDLIRNGELMDPGSKKSKKKRAPTKSRTKMTKVSGSDTSSMGTSLVEPAKKKTQLSIAETLALSRSSMKITRTRDYSSIESLDDVLRAEQLKEQSSNNRLSNKRTTNNETNLVKAIKQMTDALSKSNMTGTPSKIDTNDKSMINALVLAKQFLSQDGNGLGEVTSGESSSQSEQQTQPIISSAASNAAIGIINNALGLFKTTMDTPSTSTIAPTQPSTNDVEMSDANIDPSLAGIVESTTSTASGALQNEHVPNIDLVSSLISPSTIASIGAAVSSALASLTRPIRSVSGISSPKPKHDSPEIKEKIRLDNRERKKKWREENAERNKDNDLRCRVQKKASALFGEHESEEKKKWFNEEFERRKSKRMQRVKPEKGNKKETNDLSDMIMDTSVSITKSDSEKAKASSRIVNDLAKDPNLIRSITSIFNIFSNANNNNDTTAAITATATATAATAAVYAASNNNGDSNQITSAVSSIMTQLLNNSPQASEIDNVAGIPKGVVSSFKIRTVPQSTQSNPNPPSKLPDPELTSLVKSKVVPSGLYNKFSTNIHRESNDERSNPLAALQKLSISNFTTATATGNMNFKRKTDEPLMSEELKRPRSVSPEPTAEVLKALTEKDHSISNGANPDTIMKDTEIGATDKTQTNNSSTFSHLVPWSVSTSFKVPQYKKPEEEKPQETTTAKQGQPTETPQELPISKPKPKPIGMGLKKPGSFQRPSYSKPKNDKTKGRGMGFPPLLSSTFKN